MNLWLLATFLLVIFILLKALVENKQKERAELKYDTVKSFMSKSEKEFFVLLQSSVQDQYHVFSKVRLLDIITIQKGLKRSHYQKLKNYVQSKHVDFLLCDKMSMQPLIAIELDGKSHLNQKRKERDDFVDQIFESANMRIVHVPVASEYNIAEILQPPVIQEKIA